MFYVNFSRKNSSYRRTKQKKARSKQEGFQPHINQSRYNDYFRLRHWDAYRFVAKVLVKVSSMNYDVEITALKAKIDALEDECALLYESLDQRINDLHTFDNQKFTILGIFVTVIIGGVTQIAISLFR